MGSPEMARSTGSYQARAFAADSRVHWLSLALRKSTAQEFAAPVATFGTLDIYYFWRLWCWIRCWFALGRRALTELAAPLAAVRAVRLLLWAEGGKGAVGQSAALGAAAGAAAAPTNLTMPGQWRSGK